MNPLRDDPRPDWIRYDDGRLRQVWIGEGSYWVRQIFNITDVFILYGIRFMPYNPGRSEEPCGVRVYAEDQDTHELGDILWETEVEELREWVGNGNNWHWVEILRRIESNLLPTNISVSS